ncbi:beta-N-acetylhexosaminidase [Streptomyces sp. MP131-18]|uniref:beta-N-acetylhexosaminidase n=1 Tax=Streptomyces sp. MP131-18 TaxID=1857892 RepID=UPI0009CE0BAC|nr:beta-N-acetylhexosaminidase [Streptomyces sp. MP131-18]ONK15514.1 Beta-hexosaminidase [Streptomyces sp. MP131-18]
MSRPPAVVPRPETMHVGEGHFTFGPGTAVRAPDDIGDLLREVLGVAGGAAADEGIELSLTRDNGPGTGLGAEGYRLRVTPDGVRGEAATPAGLRWAVQTLRQLADGDRLPCVEITDRPRHAWRGSLLDVARWCHPLPFLYRYVDLLALYKLNTLHLHLTDDQGWRFEVERYPRLTEVGAFRTGSPVGHARDCRTDEVPHGGFYTQRELRGLVAHAERRGVRIMPEIDAPGHMQAAIAAHPELGNDPARRLPVRREWGISSHVLNAADETVAFVRHVLDELTDVFPFRYVHIGGDEVPPHEWRASPAARRRAAEEGLPGPDQLLGWWSARLARHLSGLGRRAAVWDELIEHGVPEGTAVFAWRTSERVTLALRQGLDVIAAPQERTYLDWSESDAPQEPLAIRAGLPMSEVYGYAPPDGVLGVQGQLWSEYLPTPELVEWRAFPRLAALAEVGWSTGGRDFAEFRRRLTAHLPLLDALGVGYRPLEPAA